MEGDLSQSNFHSTPSTPVTNPAVNPLNIFNPIISTNFSPPFPTNSSSFSSDTVSPIALHSGATPIRRGPGRPRKDGRGPLIRKSQSVGSGRTSRGAGSGGRPRVKAQLVSSIRGRSSIGSTSAGHIHHYSSTSSPSADSSSPGTPNVMDNQEAAESPFNLQFSSGASVQNNSQRCAFCYLTASSLLGQGDLLRLDPTPGLQACQTILKKPAPSSVSPIQDEPNLNLNPNDPNITLRINLKHSRVVRARKKFDNYVMDDDEVFDEMENVGLSDEIEPADVFEKTGHFFAHHCCVAWSDNMIQLESGEFELVDQAVLAAMTERCAGCGHYGASISCRAENCPKKFHYPCASAFGAFQDLKSIALFCPDHVDDALTTGMETQCANCETVKDLHELLFCTSCGQHYHSYCLDPPIQTVVSVRAGWQCPDCKSCQLCKNTNDDSKMLVCDVCDKGYHTYCVQPMLTTVPKHGWKCKNCRRCTDCRSRTPGSGPSSRWHMNYSICDSCYQQRNKGLACPICGKAYRHCKQKSMRECIQCRKHVHMDCDQLPNEPSHYICRLCRDNSSRDQCSSTSLDQTYACSNQSYSDNDEEILAAILKNEINSETFSGTESPFSDLDLANMDVSGTNFNLEWALGIEEGELTSTPSAEKSFVASTMSKKPSQGVPRKRFSSIKRSKSNSSNGTAVVGRGKGDRRRNNKGRGGTRTAVQTLTAMLSNHNVVAKHKEDDEYIHTVVVSSTKDDFVFCQDMCVICGSLGQGAESHLIACMQCGQCYHTYCAGVKLNSVIIRRGWRCLDCTVCEGCGQGDDEQHLLLCDECDVSVHTYCLDPPLDSIPSGAWRCSWCSCCLICDGPMTSIGLELMESCKICGCCASLSCCSLCRSNYRDGELIIKCEKCKKWCHGKCNGLTTEDLLDKAADSSFVCLACRPGFQQALAAAEGRTDVVDKAEYSQYVDGVALTKVGVNTVRWRPKLPSPRPSSVGSTAQCIEDVIDSVTALVKRNKMTEEIAWEEHVDSESFDGLSVEVNPDVAGSSANDHMQISPGEKHKKIRQRKNIKIGVGGFLARPGRQRSITDKVVVVGEELINSLETQESFQDGGPSIETSLGLEDPTDSKPKKRKRNRKKGHLDDSYPQYIQEAFFVSVGEKSTPIGENQQILDEFSHSTHSAAAAVGNSSEISVDVIKALEKKSLVHPIRRPSASASAHQEPSMTEGFDDIAEDSDLFPDHLQSANDFSNILDMLMREDMDPVTQDATRKMHHSPEDKNLENLIDNGAFVGIGAIDPSEMDRFMDSVLVSELRGASGPPPHDPRIMQPYGLPHQPYMVRPEIMPHPVQQFAPQSAPLTPAVEYGQEAASFFGQHSNSVEQMSEIPAHQPPSSSIDLVGAIKRESPPPAGGDLKSSMERWEQDEPLGVQATTAAVLYANLHHPDLKSKYPSWNERSKQIAKLWRTLSPEQRQQFVLLARENRTASRQVAKGKKVPGSKSVETTGRSTEPKPPMTPMTPNTPFNEFMPQQSTPYPSASSSVDYSDQQVQQNVFFPSTNTDVRHWNQNQPLLLDDLVELERREQISRTLSVPAGSQTVQQGPPPAPHRWPSQTPVGHVSPQQQSVAPIPFAPRTPPYQQGPPPQQPAVPVPPRDLYFENDMMKQQQELESQQKLLETQLNQLRRSKKNSASKQRQMRKNNVEPPEQDQLTLARLSKDISDRQKQLEQIKKHVKSNSTHMQDYQQKHGLIPQQAPVQTTAPVGPVQQTSSVRGPMSPVSQQAPGGGFQMGPQMIRSGQSPGVQRPPTFMRPPQFGSPLGPTPQPQMPFAGTAAQQAAAAAYRVLPGDNNPFSEGFSLEPRFDRRFDRPAGPPGPGYHEGPPPQFAQFGSPTLGGMMVSPDVQQSPQFCVMPPVQQQGSPVVPFASSLMAPEGETKKTKKKYRKKKQSDPMAGNLMDPNDLYGQPAPVFSPRAPYPTVSMKNAPFLDIPAPKPSPIVVRTSSDSGPGGAFRGPSLAGVTVTLSAVLDPQPNSARLRLNSTPNLSINTFACKSEPLASLRSSQFDDTFDPDVVEVVQLLIERVSLVAEGDESSENLLLKSLLQNSPIARDVDDDKKDAVDFVASNVKSSGKRPHGQGSSTQSSPKKRQRKKNQQKLTEISTGDDYTQFLDQLAAQLKSLNPLGVHEPLPRPDPQLCTLNGVTVLSDKPSKPIIGGNRCGSLKLAFMPDYYNDTFGLPVKPSVGHPNPLIQVPFGRLPVPNSVDNRPPAHHNLIFNEKPADHLGPVDPRSESPLELVYGNLPEPDEEVLPAYPALKPNIPSDGRLSPNFRLMAHVPMRQTPADPPFGALNEHVSKSSTMNQISETVGVTLTLDVEAAKNVQNVLRNLAILLNIDVPKQFEIHIDTPPHTPEKAALREFAEAQQIFCRHCDVAVQQAMVKKKFAELGLTPKEDGDDEVIFCSPSCYMQFAVNSRADAQVKDAKEMDLLNAFEKVSKPSTACESSPIKGSQRSSLEEPIRDVNPVGFLDDERLDEIIRSVVGGSLPYGGGICEKVVHVKELPRLSITGVTDDTHHQGKHSISERRWKGTKWMNWAMSMRSKVAAQLNKDIEQFLQFWHEMASMLLHPASFPADTRVCELCSTVGDGSTDVCGRLLNFDAGRWVHVNCALWSAEVYETMDGGLVNVEQAVRRSISTNCCRCLRAGATVPCYKLRCDSTFHFQCALDCQCSFMKDKTMFCPEHAPSTNENVLSNLSVLRKIYVDRDENRLLAKLFQQCYTGQLCLRVGSLIFKQIGQLLPHQLRQFSTKDFIFPVGFEVFRVYWSSEDVRRRNLYRCSISEFDSVPEFTLSHSDSDSMDVTVRGLSASDVWSNVIKSIESMRVSKKMLKLFKQYLPGESLFGLTEPCVQKMIESLPGVDTLVSYEFKFGRHPLMDLPLAVNPSGCARCEPRFRTYIKRPHTLNAATQHSVHSLLALSGISLEQTMLPYGNRQALQSKWSQYRKMKQDWKNVVYLARSKIQGLGLYARRDIEMNAMVIEYIGEIIRNEVAERREKQYQDHRHGIYMFRVDHERVLDATMTGGPARYANHSCDPNCMAELMEFDREAKIIIMSCRPISKGEEITYDYQFDFEDDNHKIPCLCGAPHCRKWMN